MGRSARRVPARPDLDNRRTRRHPGSTQPSGYTTARCTNPTFWRCFAAPAPCSRAISGCRPGCTAPAICSARWSCNTRATPPPSGRRWPTRCATWGATCVLSPALGGIVIGQEVARALDVRALFAERQDGTLTLRRGFTLSPDDRVLVVEDVVTTAGSTRETMAVAEQAGAKVVGACAIVDRSGGTHGLELPFAALLPMTLPLYEEAHCPMCKAGTPIVKPGSRSVK